MPIYSFKCPLCSRAKDVMLKITEIDISHVMCDDCKVEMNREFSSSNGSFQLKGNGWFKTGGQY